MSFYFSPSSSSSLSECGKGPPPLNQLVVSKAEVVTGYFPPAVPALLWDCLFWMILKSQWSWPDSVCSGPWGSVFQCVPLLLRLDLAVYFMHMNGPFKVNNEQIMLFKLDKCLSHYLNGNLRDGGGKSGWWGSHWGTKSYWVASPRLSNGRDFAQWTKPTVSIKKEKLKPHGRSPAEQSAIHGLVIWTYSLVLERDDVLTYHIGEYLWGQRIEMC